jgi:hypothetical protein
MLEQVFQGRLYPQGRLHVQGRGNPAGRDYGMAITFAIVDLIDVDALNAIAEAEEGACQLSHAGTHEKYFPIGVDIDGDDNYVLQINGVVIKIPEELEESFNIFYEANPVFKERCTHGKVSS